MELVELVTPDGRIGKVEPRDVERFLAAGWSRPAPTPKPAPTAASISRSSAARAPRTELPTATPPDPI